MSEIMFKAGFRFSIPEFTGLSEVEVYNLLKDWVEFSKVYIDDDHVFYDIGDNENGMVCDSKGTHWFIHVIRKCELYEYPEIIVSDIDVMELMDVVLNLPCVKDDDIYDVVDFNYFTYMWYNGTDDPMDLW